MGIGEQNPGVSAKPESLHILLVDDDWMGQTVSTAVLEEMGYRVTTAASGAEALRRWEQENYDLILMDVRMPAMDGCETTRQIRAREGRRGGRVPVIALTADTEDSDRQACLEAGMDGYVSKPVETEAVRQAIERHSPAAGKASAVEMPSAGTDAPASADHEVDDALARLGFEPLPEEDGETLAAEVPPDMLARLEDDFDAAEPDVILDEEALVRLREMEERGALSVARIVSLFTDSGKRILPALRVSLATSQLAELRREAHTLKGNARDVGAHRLAHHCQQLEETAKDGNLAGAMELIERIELAWREAGAALATYLARPGAGADT